MAIQDMAYCFRPWQETMATVRWPIETMSFCGNCLFNRFFSFRAIAYICPTLPRLCSDIAGFRHRKGVPISKGAPVLTGNPGPNMYLASYFTPGHVAVDMGDFPSAEVREYAYDGLYSTVYLGMGRPNHVTCTLFDHMSCDDDVAKTNEAKVAEKPDKS